MEIAHGLYAGLLGQPDSRVEFGGPLGHLRPYTRCEVFGFNLGGAHLGRPHGWLRGGGSPLRTWRGDSLFDTVNKKRASVPHIGLQLWCYLLTRDQGRRGQDGAIDGVIRWTHVVQDPGKRGFLDTLAHANGRESIVWGFLYLRTEDERQGWTHLGKLTCPRNCTLHGVRLLAVMNGHRWVEGWKQVRSKWEE